MLLEDRGHFTYRFLRVFTGPARARLDAGTLDARAAQTARVRVIVRGLAGTLFEAAHAMRGDEDLHAWREAVPVRTHAEYAPWLDRVAEGEPR